MSTPSFHKRKPIRMAGYDYTSSGAYFITLCTRHRQHIFGEIQAGIMGLSDAGCLAYDKWAETISRNPHVSLIECLVMPEHIHCIVGIGIGDEGVNTSAEKMQSLSRIVGTWKSSFTVGYIHMVKSGVVPPFRDQLLQRSYFERIIRNSQEMSNISQYIYDNVRNWTKGTHNDTDDDLVFLISE